MEVKVLLQVKSAKIVKSAFNCVFESPHAVQIRQHEPANAVTRVTKRDEPKFDEKAQYIKRREIMSYYLCALHNGYKIYKQATAYRNKV